MGINIADQDEVKKKIERMALIVGGSILIGSLMGYQVKKDGDFSKEMGYIKGNASIYRKVIEGERRDPVFINPGPREFGAEYWGVDDNCDGGIDRILVDPFFQSSKKINIFYKNEPGFDEVLSELEGGTEND